MKKFFYVFFSAIIAVLSVGFVGCKKDEVLAVSKGLTNYEIVADFNDETKQIIGSETIEYLNKTGDDLEYICLHLYPRAFRKTATIKPYTALNMAVCFPNGMSYGDILINKVQINGEEKQFEFVGEDEDILKIIFGFCLKKEEKIDILIDFLIDIPNSTHRFGYYQDNVNLGNWYPVVCEYAGGEFDMTPYYATGDPFNSSVSNYIVKLSYDSKYKLTSTGEVNEKIENGKTVAEVSAKAVRDFAMCLSSNFLVQTEVVDGVTVSYAGYKQDENTGDLLSVSVAAIKYFNETFGKYPYKTLSVVKTPFVYGGMEYPGIVFVSDSIDDGVENKKVIVHEIAHQWWYSVVGNNEAKEAWLDESLSEYSTAMFFAANDGFGITYDEIVDDAMSSYLLYVDVIQTIRGEVNSKMNLAVNEYQNDYEYSYMVYVKGVIMFDSLKQTVGEKKMIQGFRKYYEDNKFKIATKDDFYAAFKSACHQDLETFFEGYLNGSSIISKIN